MSANLRSPRQLRATDDRDVLADVEGKGGATRAAEAPKFVPYTGSESVPELVKGKKFSAPALEVARFGKSFKVLRYRRSAIGIVRDTLRMLQPANKKRPVDKGIMAQLKRAGIPGAV